MATPPPPPRDLTATLVLSNLEVPPSFTLRVSESADERTAGRRVSGPGPFTVGRVDPADLVLDDRSVSRRHASVEAIPGGFLLRDLGSANGTWVGDRRVQECRLDHLDRFRVGGTVVEVVRDDDQAGNALDVARTTSIPVREIVAGIRASLEGGGERGRLEDEGEEVVVAANRPFLLADPASVWLVESGRMDVFTVAVKDGEPAGPRSHFVSVEPGLALFGMDLAAYGAGSGFLVSGKAGTRLRKIPLARLRELGADPRHARRVAGLLEAWTSTVSRSVVRDIPPGRPVDEELEEGRVTAADFQVRVRAKKGVAWVEVGPGALLFLGLSEVAAEGRILFPVTREGWVESARDGLELTPAPEAGTVSRPELWAGLASFHRAVCESEFVNKRLATVDEFNRLRTKSENAEAAREAALREIGGVMAGPSAGRETVDATDADPLLRACRQVCAVLGMEARMPLGPRPEQSVEDGLEAIAVASRFRIRKVALRGAWWREDHGPMLATVEDDSTPVALLPAGPGAYDRFDTATRTRTRVTRDAAELLAPFAWTFYRRFPDGRLTARDIVRFGAHGMRRELWTLVGMGAALGILGSVTPYFTGQVFDMAIPRGERGLLLQVCLALFVTAFSSMAFTLTQAIASLRVQGKMDSAVQAALWDRLLDLPSDFFRKYSAGDLADRAQGIDAIWQLLAGAGLGAILGGISALFYVAMMLAYSVPLALAGILLTLVFVTFTTGADLLQLRLQRHQLAIHGRIAGLVSQLIEGVAKLRVTGSEPHGFRVWARDFAEQRRLGFRVGRLHTTVTVFSSAYPVLASIAIFGTLSWTQHAALVEGRPGGLITTGEFLAFFSSFGLFMGAVQALGEASLSLLKVVPIWERLAPILATPAEVDDSKAPPSQLRGEIEISHLSFRYGTDSPYVLKNISLKVNAGEFVAFVGASGCGKSTLMRLMLGFETPETGSIYYDGQDLAALDIRLVRRQLGVVLQDSCVLPADIYRNIVGNSSRTIEEAWEAAEACGFAQDIRDLPMGMHTYVSEGGGTFSGGQRQRLMIARAIVGKPRILFLDEATSALDNRTQAIVTESMNRMRSTRVVIAHRLSTIEKADRIVYLEGGEIRESGTYDELMKRKGLFYELARRQQV